MTITRNYIMKILVLLGLVALVASITFAEFQEQMLAAVTSPFVHLLFAYDSSSELGPALEQVIADIAQKKEGYFKILPIDCNTDDQDLIKGFPYCGAQIRPKLPALIYTEPALNTYTESGELSDPKQHQYQGKLQQKSLFDFAVPLMKVFSVQLKKVSDWRKFQQAHSGTPKLIYFTDKERIPPFYRALTANFRNTIAFAHVFSNSSLCAQFGVSTFPTLLLNGKQKIDLTANLLQQIQTLKKYEGRPQNITIQQMLESAGELTEQNFEERIMKNPQHILIHVPAADGSPHSEWRKSQQSFKKMFEYFQAGDLATFLGVKHRPAMVYFPKSLAKKEIKKTIFYSNNDFRSIYDEISGLIEDFTVPLSSDMQMQKMTSLPLEEGRFVAILFHKDEISLSYRVLSNHEKFKNDIVFFRMRDPAPDVLGKFQLKKLPALLIMTSDPENQTTPTEEELKEGRRGMNLQVAHYTGKFNYDDLEKYLNVFVAPTKAEEPVPEAKALNQIKLKKHFEHACGGEGCYLLLLDNGEEKTESNQAVKELISRLADKTPSPVAFIDGKCHSQVLGPLQIYAEELPAFIYLNPKFEKYSRLVGRIEEKAVLGFYQRVRGGKGAWRGYTGLTFVNHNCKEEHARLKRLQNAASELSPQEAEILEEVRRDEELRKKEVGDSGEGKKKRRKRRPKEEESSL